MEEVHKNLFVGDDKDYEKLKNNKDWSFLRCCKEGPGGHRDTLNYHTLGAPKNSNYLFVYRNNKLSLNLIDVNDPDLIPEKVIFEGIKFINEQLIKNRKILVACNAGHSRGPTTALLYLRTIGEYPERFRMAEKKFKAFYPKYDPGIGMRTFSRTHWKELEDINATVS